MTEFLIQIISVLIALILGYSIGFYVGFNKVSDKIGLFIELLDHGGLEAMERYKKEMESKKR